MTDETRTSDQPESSVPSAKRRWSTPRIETVAGREARANFARYGGTDAGIYS